MKISEKGYLKFLRILSIFFGNYRIREILTFTYHIKSFRKDVNQEKKINSYICKNLRNFLKEIKI